MSQPREHDRRAGDDVRDDATVDTSGRSGSTRSDAVRRDGAGPVANGRWPVPPTAEEGPHKPTAISGRGWWAILRRTVKEFQEDNLGDWAAALTYYGILSLFPGLLVLVSLLGLTGQTNSEKVVNNLSAIAPKPVRDLLTGAINNLNSSRPSTASVVAIIGLAVALWSASGYVGAFMRASNAIYDVPEGRPIWKKLPTRLAVTIAAGVIVTITALSVVLTGSLARQLGKLIGLGDTFVTVWDIAKWPVLVFMISLLFSLLYWASPNAKPGGARWVTPGGILAVLIWLAASAGFAFYVANFSSYNKTYGSLATPIIFLVWLWISNLAILLGAEFNAEIQRSRAIDAGHPADAEPYVPLRDTSKIDEKDIARESY
jgi:membrane protein